MSEVRASVERHVPGVKIELAQLMEDLIGDLTAVPQPIEVKLFGDNPGQLRDVAIKVAKAVSRVRGIVDAKSGIVTGDAIDIRVDRQEAAFEGVTPSDITTQLSDYITGSVESQVEQSTKMVGIPRLQLRANDGHLFPLSRVAQLRIVTGQPEIDRENLRRMVAVTARVPGRSVGSVATDVQQALQSQHLIPNKSRMSLAVSIISSRLRCTI